jgi:hypothetical protein
MSHERRRSPRVQILGRLHGQVVAFDLPVAVIDISLGGLNFQASVPFPVGAVHDFRLTLGDASHVVLRGRVVHSTLIADDDDAHVYVMGVQFIDEEPEVEGVLRKIH